jgi:hypothetical protein
MIFQQDGIPPYILTEVCACLETVTWQINRKCGTCSVAAASFMSEVVRFLSANS